MNTTLYNNYVSFTGISPTALLKRFQHGKRPKYTHDCSNDLLQAQLNSLATNYKAKINIHTKKELLLKERELLFQELKQPELTLARNYKELQKIIPNHIKSKNLTDLLLLYSVSGLVRSYYCPVISEVETTDKELNTLVNVYQDFDEKTKVGCAGRKGVLYILNRIRRYNPKIENKIENILDDLYKNEQNEDIRNEILSDKSDIDIRELINRIEQEPFNSSVFREVLVRANVNDEELTAYVNNRLKANSAPKDIMRLAILGAGKFRSDENFEIIKNIALDKDEQDVRKREFALHSTALYLQEKPKEVNEIMDAVISDGTVFSPLARILKDKINGTYHGQKDREINYAGLTPEEAQNFKTETEKYIISENNLNTQQINRYQTSLIPFIKYLKKIAEGGKFQIFNDTMTRFEPSYAGVRQFRDFSETIDFSSSGIYVDSFHAAHSDNVNFLNIKLMADPSQINAIAHETGHLLNDMCPEITKDLEVLYKNAITNNSKLTDYAITSQREYFAVGVEAYATIYLPHNFLLSREDYAKSIYKLMDKDPDLYRYIDNLLRKEPYACNVS